MRKRMGLKYGLSILLGILFIGTANAQCKGFAKRKCVPVLTPYVSNGQMSSAKLFAGDSAEISMTFYSGQEYRFLPCIQDILGDIEVRVMDEDRNTIYERSSAQMNAWDFNVKQTQQLIIVVKTEENEHATGIAYNGCVTLLVGFKGDLQSPKNY